MRVLLITDGIYPYVMGGMQKHSYYLGKFLARKGVRVCLVHCTPDNTAGRELARMGLSGSDAANITFQRLPFPVSSRLPGHYLRESKRYSTLVYERVKAHLDDFDLVYCQGFTAWAFLRARRGGKLRIPVLSNLHGYEMFQRAPSFRTWLLRGPMRRLARRISLGSDAVFSFGGRITEILLGMGVCRENILECPIGIEESWLVDAEVVPGCKERVFVFLGRDERRKGVKELSLALKGLIQDGSTGFKFHFIGPIDEGHKVVDERIVYHGAVHDEERVKTLLRAADVLLCASYAEGMPTVILEGMASGLAVIGTDVGAIGQLIDGNGWLLARPEPSAIKAAMEEAMRLPAEELAGMKRRSLEKARDRFTWEQVIDRKLELMSRCARRVQ